MKRYSVLILLFLVVSCSKSNNANLLQTVAFDVDFNISHRFSGTFYDETSKKVLIYFADPVSAKKMKIYDDDGVVKDSINLQRAVEALDYKINGIAVFSKDSIVLNSMYTNKLVFVNRKGEIWKQLDLTRHLIDNDNVYEITSSTMSDFKMGNSLLFGSDWRMNLNDVDKKDGLEASINFYNQCFKSNYFFKVSNFKTDSLETKFGLSDFYSRLYDKPAVLVGPPFYTFVNNKLFLTSNYTNKIFEIDTTALSIRKSFVINSDYTKIGAEPVVASKEGLTNLQEKINTILKSKGFISRIFYNKSVNKYIVIVYHEGKNGEIFDDISKRPFSIILLDNNFKKIEEIPFFDMKLRGGFSFMTSKGLMIASAESLSEIKSNEKKFYIFAR